ncbi:MAG: hypothetical protein WKF55_14540 [Gemmatimonadaceae bacterium]
MRFPLLFCAILPFVSNTSAAQASIPDLSVGTRVRISAPEILPRRFIGAVSELDQASLKIAEQKTGDQIVVPFSALKSVELSTGRSRGSGAWRGAVIGLLAGVGLGVACVSICDTGNDANLAPAAGLLFGPPAGAVLGAIIGKESWQKVSILNR